MAGQPATAEDVRLGARIRSAREAACLTQRAIATALGMSAAQLQKYEKGTNRIAAVHLAIVARLTGRPLASFFDGPELDPTAPEPTVDQAWSTALLALEAFRQACRREGDVGAERRADLLLAEAA